VSNSEQFGSSPVSQKVEAFYDALSPAFVRDYLRGNKRVERQFQFFQAAIQPEAKNILVIGCGSGEGAHFIATRIARRARILAIDISSANIELARGLFLHPNIEYRKCDILAETIDGRWDVIVLPDVYEHIPLHGRPKLHAQFAKLMTPQGRVLLTVPSEQTQKSLSDPQNTAHKPQVIDEVVSLSDLMQLAEEIGGSLTYFASISVWQSNDYVHAIVERRADRSLALTEVDRLPVKAGPPLTPSAKLSMALRRKIGLASLARWRKRKRVARLVRKTA
jgi:trans-aconitate methyltransferase